MKKSGLFTTLALGLSPILTSPWILGASMLLLIAMLLPQGTISSTTSAQVSSMIRFTEHTIAGDFVGASSVYATDVDGDGDVDVLGAAYGTISSDGYISWWENDGDENFTPHDIFGNQVSVVYAADVNGDGDVDVLGASHFSDRVTWWENDGDENFIEHTVAVPFDGASSVFAADLDGDGDVDVLGTARWADDITWWENDGDENFTEHTLDGDFDAAASVYATDMDGDGDVDVLGAAEYDSDNIVWWENDGDESFTKHAIDDNCRYAVSAYAADVDGDGDVDVLGAASELAASPTYDVVAWWENDGNENFTRHLIDSHRGADSVYATDVDGDGDVDVLGAASGANDIAWWEQGPTQPPYKYHVYLPMVMRNH